MTPDTIDTTHGRTPPHMGRSLCLGAILTLCAWGFAGGSGRATPADLRPWLGTWWGELVTYEADGSFTGGGTPIDLVLDTDAEIGTRVGEIRYLNRQTWTVDTACTLLLALHGEAWLVMTAPDCDDIAYVTVHRHERRGVWLSLASPVTERPERRRGASLVRADVSP